MKACNPERAPLRVTAGASGVVTLGHRCTSCEGRDESGRQSAIPDRDHRFPVIAKKTTFEVFCMSQIRRLTPSDIDSVVAVIAEHVFTNRAESRRPVIERASNREDGSALGFVSVVDETVVGCVVCTVHNQEESLSQFFARPVPHETTHDFALLRYAYVKPEHMSCGYGTVMLRQLLSRLRTAYQVQTVYVEAWLRPGITDIAPLMRKFDFDKIFYDEEYWRHPANHTRLRLCSYCKESKTECECSGAIYRLFL